MSGRVYLVGAGPGDPGLLTARALELIAAADVVLYDRLIPAQALEGARGDAELLYVGKEGGGDAVPQEQTEALLVARARAGKLVVRLKGGDPFVFGRGGEEALALVAAGVPFRIVPGITAGIGGLAYAGIPLTHRDTNSAVTFVTGHSSDGAVPDGLDWDALARGSPALVVYMAMRHLPSIVERLLAAGRPPDEPAAVISKATTEAQRVLVTSLAELAVAAAAAGLEAPAIVVIGRIVRLREGLDWLGALAGRRLHPDPLGRSGSG